MADAGDMIRQFFRAALNRDGQAPSLEEQAEREGEVLARLATEREPEAAPAPQRSRRQQPVVQPKQIILESLAQKVLYAWLRNRHQTLYPLSLNFETLDPAQVQLLIHAMAVAITADGQVEGSEQDQAARSLATIGAGEAEHRMLIDAIARPRPLASLLEELQQAHLGAYAYAVSLIALNQRNAVNQLYLDYLAARLGLPSEVVTSLNRRYRM